MKYKLKKIVEHTCIEKPPIILNATASRVHPFCHLQSRARTRSVLGIGLYELLDPST
jgi:hypothetical protein